MGVVPGSSMKFQDFDDKEGNSLWRVVMFKSCVDAFKKACREKARGVTTRDFEYSEEVYNKLIADREKAEEHEKRLKGQIRKLYEAAWSDAFCSWIHVKAMRVFVESVLCFGIGDKGPQFASYILAPKAGAQAAARKVLADTMGGQDSSLVADAGDEAGGEEFFPYVSFSFTPFTTAR